MRTSLLILLLAGCGGPPAVPPRDGGPPPPDAGPPHDYFVPGEVLEIQIEMTGADWDAMRMQTRDFFSLLVGADCLADPFGSPFTYFDATVTIDGERREHVGIRKKGFLGSLSMDKPSLKLDFDRFVSGQDILGTTRFTLNNALQDPSYVHQCIGYDLFRRAGVPAPRCNFAHVTLNGTDLGIYVHIEDVRPPFLREHFGDDSGQLFEGTLSDFRDGWTGTFEGKNDVVDASGIDALTAAAARPDAELMAALEPLLDVDAFVDFWVMEVMIGHWDGYSGNTNNFHLYFDPQDGRAHLIPWGIDAIFYDQSPLGMSGSAQPVNTTGILASRMYALPEMRTRYEDRMRALLASVWDETYLLGEIDRMQALLTPYLQARDTERGFSMELDGVRAFVATREARLLGALAVAYDPPPVRTTFCFIPIGDLTGTFDTTYGTLGVGNPFMAPNAGTLDLTLASAPIAFVSTGGAAGPDMMNAGRAVSGAFGYQFDGTIYGALVETSTADLRPGNTVSVDFRGAFGFLIRIDPTTMQGSIAGLLGGTISFTDASPTPDAPMRGSIAATVYQNFLAP